MTNGTTLSSHDDQIAIQRAREAALRFLSFRLRSEHEMRTFLVGKRFPKDIIDQTIGYLTETGLLDDRKFARWWTESRMHGGWGPRRIVQELKMKGVNKDIIDEEMKRDWKDVTRQVLEKEQSKLHALPPMKRRMKMQQVLLRRGFSFDTITRAVDERQESR